MNNDLDRRVLLGAAGIAGMAAMAGASRAGPLNPPAGAVASTAKPLSELEPRIAVNATNTPGNSSSDFIISSPGSYYMTGNVFSGRSAVVTITSTDVVLDLNGFTLSNVFFDPAVVVIAVSGLSVTIRNGTLASTLGKGISCNSADTTLVVDGVNIRTGALGIYNPGTATVTRCVVTQTVSSQTPQFQGIFAGSRSRVSDCTVLMNTAFTTPSANQSIAAGEGSIVESCVVNGGGIGILMVDGIVRGCRVQEQNNTGIRINGGVCENNSIGGVKGIGIACGGAEVRGNRVSGVGAANAVGVYIIGGGNTIAGNTIANFYGTNGYSIATSSNSNLGGNKIMDNELNNNWRHLNITAPYNLIVRNSMSFGGAGGNVSFAAGNSFGPVINAGNTDLSTVAGSGHPQANLAY